MLKRIVSGIMLTLLLIGILTLAFDIQPTKAGLRTLIVPNDYPTIQEAIIAASCGDTVYVSHGIYFENVVVNKAVLLVGESKETTIIDGCGSVNVVKVNADNVTITGFTIENDRKKPFCNGIMLGQVKNCNVSGNNITNDYFGIVLNFCSNISITGNRITNTQYGIGCDYCSNCSIIGNTVTYSYLGIGPDDSSGNRIIGNNVTNCNYGIGSHFPLNNNIISRNNLINNGYGVWLCFSSGNNVTGNSITDNNISNNGCGIWLSSCSNGSINGNRIANNGHGLILSSSSNNNSIAHNNFEANHVHVNIDASYGNLWDDNYPYGGNYWSDYNGSDNNHDGIGDIPYIIDQLNTDRYPLMNPWTPTDTNRDGNVNVLDLIIVANALNSMQGDPEWNPNADVNDDQTINVLDLIVVANYLGT